MTVPFFLQAAFKSTILLAAVWLVMLLLHRRSAAWRHQVWTLALAAVLALPFFSTILPAWNVPVSSSILADTVLFRSVVRAGQAVPANMSPLPPSQSSSHMNGSLLVTLWALGATVSLGQMLMGWFSVRRLARNATPAAIPEFDALKREVGVAGKVELWETLTGSMPIAYGVTQQAILIPTDAASWSDDRRRAVLLHELAHVRRHDTAKQLLARLTLALYWWHPLVWLTWGAFLKERERAADDLVLNLGANATDYASHLLAIARSLQVPESFGWAAMAMARPSQLETRLGAILDGQRDRKAPPRASTIMAFGVAMVIAVPWATFQAKAATGQESLAAIVVDSPAAALLLQGKTALAEKRYEAAFDLFARAQGADSKLTGEAEMWQAITREAQGNFASAADLYKEALAATPDSPAAATIGELYAPLLLKLDRQTEATNVSAQAASLREVEQALANQKAQLSPDARHVGGDVNAPTLITKVEPQYAPDAKLAKYSGAVLLILEIGTDGVPRNVAVLRGLGLGLDQKAVDAVKQWRFTPGTLNGDPVPVTAHVEVDFRLM